jgi:L-2-hydroxyglutarate oxidase LhgO
VFDCRGVVNCAGLSADKVLEMVLPPSVRIFPTAGDYLVLDTKTRV